MTTNRIRCASTNIVRVEDVLDGDAGIYATDANAAPVTTTHQCALLAGDKITLITDLVFAYVAGTRGRWRAVIAPSIALTEDAPYYARFTIAFTSGINAGVARRFDVPCVAVGHE